jgi:hypothetical protein
MGAPKRPHDPDRIDANSIADCQEFHDIEAPLAALVFRDVRLRPAEPSSDFCLGEVGFTARLHQQGAKRPMSGRTQRFRRLLSASHAARSVFPLREYPKIG